MNIKEVRELLDKYNLNAKKGFGQNFLIDDNILKKIAFSLDDKDYQAVIEVGPGLGSLTRYFRCIFFAYIKTSTYIIN